MFMWGFGIRRCLACDGFKDQDLLQEVTGIGSGSLTDFTKTLIW
jgi:hypothetical protein